MHLIPGDGTEQSQARQDITLSCILDYLPGTLTPGVVRLDFEDPILRYHVSKTEINSSLGNTAFGDPIDLAGKCVTQQILLTALFLQALPPRLHVLQRPSGTSTRMSSPVPINDAAAGEANRDTCVFWQDGALSST
jgi:hypothetical protein